MFKTEPLFSPTGKQGSAKNLNNLLADDEDADQPEAQPQSLIEQLLSFFAKLWSPGTSDAEKLGYSYVYDEDGTLLGEYGAGGSQSSGTSQYSACGVVRCPAQKTASFRPGCVANPRDTCGYRCGLRLALTKNPSVFNVPPGVQHHTTYPPPAAPCPSRQ